MLQHCSSFFNIFTIHNCFMHINSQERKTTLGKIVNLDPAEALSLTSILQMSFSFKPLRYTNIFAQKPLQEEGTHEALQRNDYTFAEHNS